MICESCGPLTTDGAHQSMWCEHWWAAKLNALMCKLRGHRYQTADGNRASYHDWVMEELHCKCGSVHRPLGVPPMPKCKPPAKDPWDILEGIVREGVILGRIGLNESRSMLADIDEARQLRFPQAKGVGRIESLRQ
jgi:hypothetical protein